MGKPRGRNKWERVSQNFGSLDATAVLPLAPPSANEKRESEECCPRIGVGLTKLLLYLVHGMILLRCGGGWSRWSDQHASWMILVFAHDVLQLASKPSPLLSPICGRLRICFPSSDTPGPWRLVSKRDVPSNASYRAGYLVQTVGSCRNYHDIILGTLV